MKNKPKQHWVKEKDWTTVKLLLAHDVSIVKIRDITGLGRSTIHLIKNSSSLEGYKALRLSQRKQQVPESKSIPVHSEFKTEEPERAEITLDELLKDILTIIDNLDKIMGVVLPTLERIEGKLDDVLDTKRPWLKNIRK